MTVEDTRIACFPMVLLCLLGVNYIIVAMSHALPTFYNYTPQFYCESSDGANKSYGCVMNAMFETPGQNTQSFCMSEYIFVTEYGERSIVTDWGLICDRSYLKKLSAVAYHVGIAMGAWIAGIFIDQIGRLPVLAICLYIQGTITVAIYTVQSYPVFLTMCGLQGLFTQGLQSSTYILTIELFPAKFRTLVATAMNIAWALGLLSLGGLSYIIPDWRILQLAVAVPTAITVLYIWILPESPRWLLAKGQTTEADIVLDKMEKYNACCRNKESSRKKLVAENPTQVEPERVSPIFGSKLGDKNDARIEMTNLLMSNTPNSHNSERISLRAISENLEKRLSNIIETKTFIHASEINICDDRGIPLHTQNIENSNISLNFGELTSEAKIDNDQIHCEILPEQMIEEVISEEIDNRNKRDENEEMENGEKFRCCWILNNWCLIKYSTIMACQWFSLSVMKFMVVHFIPNLVDNRHINFAIGSIVELTIYVVIYFILSRYGRRFPMGVCQALNGVICISIVLVLLPRMTALWSDSVRMMLLWLSRVTTVSTLAVLYLYSVEIFPTVIRGTCVGICMVVDCIGGISTPFITSLTNYPSVAPLIFAGVMCFLSAPLNLLLPETLGDALPDTVCNMVTLGNGNGCKSNITATASDREILRERLFSDDWVDVGNGIIVNFPEIKN